MWCTGPAHGRRRGGQRMRRGVGGRKSVAVHQVETEGIERESRPTNGLESRLLHGVATRGGSGIRPSLHSSLATVGIISIA